MIVVLAGEMPGEDLARLIGVATESTFVVRPNERDAQFHFRAVLGLNMPSAVVSGPEEAKIPALDSVMKVLPSGSPGRHRFTTESTVTGGTRHGANRNDLGSTEGETILPWM